MDAKWNFTTPVWEFVNSDLKRPKLATSFPGHCACKASWVPHFSWVMLFNGHDSIMVYDRCIVYIDYLWHQRLRCRIFMRCVFETSMTGCNNIQSWNPRPGTSILLKCEVARWNYQTECCLLFLLQIYLYCKKSLLTSNFPCLQTSQVKKQGCENCTLYILFRVQDPKNSRMFGNTSPSRLRKEMFLLQAYISWDYFERLFESTSPSIVGKGCTLLPLKCI